MDMNTLAKPAKRYGLTVNANGAYAIEFAHETHEGPTAANSGARGWDHTICVRGRTTTVWSTRRTTVRLIQLQDDGSEAPVADAAAYCSQSDTYDREIGRQVALFELLRQLPKEAGKDKAHLGRKILAAYCDREGALPWVLDSRGHVDYGALAEARYLRQRERSAEHIMQQFQKIEGFIEMHERGRAQAMRLAQMMGLGTEPAVDVIKH